MIGLGRPPNAGLDQRRARSSWLNSNENNHAHEADEEATSGLSLKSFFNIGDLVNQIQDFYNSTNFSQPTVDSEAKSLAKKIRELDWSSLEAEEKADLLHTVVWEAFFGQEKLIELIKDLLEAGADPNYENGEGYPVIFVDGCEQHHSPKAAELLLDAGVDIDAQNEYGQTLAHKAVFSNRVDMLEMLMDRGASFLLSAKGHENSVLHGILQESGFDDDFKLKVIEYVDDFKSFDENNSANVLASALHGRCGAKVVAKLIEKGADVNLPTKSRLSILERAIENQDLEVIEILLKNGARLDLANSNGDYPIHQAVVGGSRTVSFGGGDDEPINNLDIVKLLCKYGADVNMHNQHGVSPLTLAVGLGSKGKEISKGLLKLGADKDGIWAQTANDECLELRPAMSPLQNAAKADNLECFIDLLLLDADIDFVNSNGETALYWAAHTGNASMVQLLLDAGAKIYDDDLPAYCNPLYAACLNGNKEVEDLLMAKFKENKKLVQTKKLDKSELLIKPEHLKSFVEEIRFAKTLGAYKEESRTVAWVDRDDDSSEAGEPIRELSKEEKYVRQRRYGSLTEAQAVIVSERHKRLVRALPETVVRPKLSGDFDKLKVKQVREYFSSPESADFITVVAKTDKVAKVIDGTHHWKRPSDLFKSMMTNFKSSKWKQVAKQLEAYDFAACEAVQDTLKEIATYLIMPTALFFGEHSRSDGLTTEDLLTIRDSHTQKLASSIFANRDLRQVLRLSDRFHEDMARISSDEIRDVAIEGQWHKLHDDISVKVGGGKTYQIYSLDKGTKLKDVGRKMSNCVGSYVEQCKSGQQHISAIVGDDGSLVSVFRIEIVSDTKRSGDFVRVKGKRNQYLRLTEHLGLKNKAAPPKAVKAYEEFKRQVESGEIEIGVRGIGNIAGKTDAEKAIFDFIGYEDACAINVNKKYQDLLEAKFKLIENIEDTIEKNQAKLDTLKDKYSEDKLAGKSSEEVERLGCARIKEYQRLQGSVKSAVKIIRDSFERDFLPFFIELAQTEFYAVKGRGVNACQELDRATNQLTEAYQSILNTREIDGGDSVDNQIEDIVDTKLNARLRAFSKALIGFKEHFYASSQMGLSNLVQGQWVIDDKKLDLLKNYFRSQYVKKAEHALKFDPRLSFGTYSLIDQNFDPRTIVKPITEGSVDASGSGTTQES